MPGCPERVDAVLDSVGAATWSHSINVVEARAGRWSSAAPRRETTHRKAELTKIFFKPLRVIGSAMGTRDELISLTRMLVATGVRPHDRPHPAADGCRQLDSRP